LIEQQTFGATTQIGSRAVIYLHMYSPPANQTLTLTLPDPHSLSVPSAVIPIDSHNASQTSATTSQGVAP
jgi:hypothetical protein